WWLQGDGTMYKGDTTGPFGSIIIMGGESNTWIADYSAAEDTAFPLNTNWTGYLTFASAPQDGHNFGVEIGYSDGTDFTPGEPNATLEGDGSKTAFAFETSAAEFTVPKDNYLALRITGNDSDYEVRTGGGWSFISSPKTDPGYPREGLMTNFSAEPIVVGTGEDVNFTSETSGGSPPYTYKWYFGDGETSTEPNPTHKYETHGFYTVALSVADSHRNKAIAVKENCITVIDIDFATDERIFEVDETIEFSDRTEGGSPPYEYEWDFNYNGTVDSTLQNPSWSYGETGTYNVSLKINDSEEKSATGVKDDFITVFDPELTIDPVGSFGGSACSVAVQGNYAYLGQGLRLIALNISGEEPEKVGSLALPDIASEIFIKDNYAYIANSESGLSIVDISRPANLTIAGSAHIPDGECKGVFVSGNYAYLAAGEKGLQVVNISNPSNPYVDSSLEIGRLRHVFIPGPYYGGGNSPETVVLNEVHPSNETSGEWIEIYNGGSENISLVDWRLMNGTGDLNYTIPETGADWNGTLEPGEYLVVHITKEEDTPGWDIYANLSELLNDTGDSISLFDNESNAVDFMRYGNCTYAPPVGTEWHGDNPEAPTASQSIGRNKNSTDTDDGADWENTGGIDSGFPTPGEQNFNIILYAVGYDPQHWRFSLWTIDITDPSNPTQIGSGDIERDEGLFVLGTYAYIAATFSGGLQILDIENALNPSLVGSFGAWDVAVFDVFVRIGSTYAYLAATNSGLVIVNVTDPENITQVASLDIEGGANSIHVTYPYAYLAGRGDIGFIEVNISDPSDLTVPQKMEEPGSIHGTCISGSYLYLSSNDRLWAYNLSGPDDPTPAASYTNWTNMDCLFAQGNYLYALDGEKMYVIDIFDPYNLSEEGTYEPNGWPIWLHVSGSYAYILTGWPDKLLIIDISIPSSPKKEGELNLSDTGVDVFVENNIAHIVYSKEGLQLIDVSNPEFPAELGFAHIVGEGNCIWAFGNYTFVGSSTEGEWYLEAFNVSDPKNPRRVAVTGGLGDSINIKGENNTLFLAVLGGGFYILEFNLTREVFTFLGKQHSQETGAKGRGASTSGTDEGGTRGGGSMGSYRSVIQIGDWNPETRSGHIYKSEVVRDKPPWYRIKWGVLRLEVKLKKHENEECCLETTVSPSDAADDGCKASPAYTEGKCGSKVNVAATAAEGWIFDKWTGAAGGSIPTTKATMTEKCSVAVAHFVPKCCLETEVSPVEAAIDGCTATPAYTEGKCGDKVDVEAIEVEPWNFVEWTGAASGGSPVTEATMDGHCSIAIAHFIRPSLTLGNGSGPRFICPKAENKNVTIINISLCINPADNWIVRSVTFNAYGSGSEKDDITEARLYLGGADGVLLDTGTYSADNGTITFNVDTVIRVGSCINLVMVYDFVEMNCSSPCKAFNAEINVTGVSALPINYPHFIKRSDPENITGGPVVIGCVWNVDTEECFDTIQEAIDDPDTKNGHTIEVCPGTYTENVNVTKELTIRSIINDPEETIIRAVDE
ncbi:MAG: PKD domain-containing protein, partial [Thermoplasmata archaeon]|nr:PKD domain-containing protein [Thermoplasmata archaeon]